MLKIILSLLIGIFALTHPISVLPTEKEGKTIVITPTTKGPNKRPSAPSRQRVTCDLFDTYLTIQFAFPEGTALIVIEEMENKTENIVNTSSEIFLPTNGMDFEKITITTEYGNTYEGYIQL